MSDMDACRAKSGGQVETGIEELREEMDGVGEAITRLQDSLHSVTYLHDDRVEALAPEPLESLCGLADSLRESVSRLRDYRERINTINRGIQL